MERGEQDSGQKSRREAFEHSDMDGVIVTRRLLSERVRHLSERESKNLIAHVASEVLNPMLESYTSGDTLKEFKEVASRKRGYPLSTPHLSASVIYNISYELSRAATGEFKNNELSSIAIEAICADDISMGMDVVAYAIISAENAIMGTFDNNLGKFAFEPLGEASEQANLFFVEKAKALKYSKFLKEDPTGRDLIRRVVEAVENPQTKYPSLLKEFVVHGARFAERAYGIVYPLAEKISKPT